MKNAMWIIEFAVAVFFLAFAVSTNGQGDETGDETVDQSLIVIGLTTHRDAEQSGDGAFSAEVLAHNGLVVALHDCRPQVQKLVEKWASEYELTLIEWKPGEDSIEVTYASRDPAGNFILDYNVSEKLDKARVNFVFRSLVNTEVSGDLVGLRPLGNQLLQAIQCVPGR